MAARLLISMTVVLAVAAVAVGCGGGEADPLPKAAFVKQGNAICANASKEREAALKEASKDGGDSGAEELIDEAVLPPTQQMADELDDLGVPKGGEKQVEAMLAGLEKGIETVEADPREALGSTAFEKSNEAAVAYGLTECAI